MRGKEINTADSVCVTDKASSDPSLHCYFLSFMSTLHGTGSLFYFV